ncbi:hypothetical protein [Mycobacterium lehmannii]|nr:hypothetical protein [Mycobacterium lehmannii]
MRAEPRSNDNRTLLTRYLAVCGALQKLHAGNTVYSIDDEAMFYVGGGFVEIDSGAEALVGLAYDVPTGTVPGFIEVHADPLSPGVQTPLT